MYTNAAIITEYSAATFIPALKSSMNDEAVSFDSCVFLNSLMPKKIPVNRKKMLPKTATCPISVN